jgi:hypothetical protein
MDVCRTCFDEVQSFASFGIDLDVLTGDSRCKQINTAVQCRMLPYIGVFVRRSVSLVATARGCYQ